MSSTQIKIRMEAKSNEMRVALAELSKWHTEKSKEISDVYIRQMRDLNIQLRHAELQEAEEDEGWSTSHKEGTKLKWVSSTDPETYSVAIVKKDGILEV